MNLTRDFIHKISELFPEKSSEQEIKVTSDLLLDGISVAALGSAEPSPQILSSMAHDADQRRSATIIKGDRRATVESAALVNGAAMHVLDYEPMWNPANHSLSTTLPALVALSEVLLRSEKRDVSEFY